MPSKASSQLFCIDCGEATPLNEGKRPAACVHCQSTFPSAETSGTDIRPIPASGMETADNEPDLDPDKFWEIPAAFKSREEANAHHTTIRRRKIGTAIFILILGIAATYYLNKNAPPYQFSEQVEAATAPGSPEAALHTKAIETAVTALQSIDWSELKKFIPTSEPTHARMARFYRTNKFQQRDVFKIESVTGDPTTQIYDVRLHLKNAPTRSISVDLSGNTPQIHWESFAKYPNWTWQQFASRKNNTSHEVYLHAKQIAASRTAIEDIGIAAENAVGLALWHSDPSRPIYSLVDKTTTTGQAIIAATNNESGTKLVLNLIPAPEPAPSFLVIVRDLVQEGW